MIEVDSSLNELSQDPAVRVLPEMVWWWWRLTRDPRLGYSMVTSAGVRWVSSPGYALSQGND